MLKVKKSVLPEELLLNETEKKLLEEEEKKYGTKLMEMPKDQKYGMCFACGEENPVLITVLLDEIMGNYLFKKEGVPAYTARIDLRFRTPVQIGTTIRCEGHEVKRKGRLVVMEGVIINPDGTVAAEATSTLMLEK